MINRSGPALAAEALKMNSFELQILCKTLRAASELVSEWLSELVSELMS